MLSQDHSFAQHVVRATLGAQAPDTKLKYRCAPWMTVHCPFRDPFTELPNDRAAPQERLRLPFILQAALRKASSSSRLMVKRPLAGHVCFLPRSIEAVDLTAGR